MTESIGHDWQTQIEYRREGYELEAKKTLGAIGRGELPRG